MNDFIEYGAVGVFTLMSVYLVARLVTAAFFKSKQQYESEKQHGPK